MLRRDDGIRYSALLAVSDTRQAEGVDAWSCADYPQHRVIRAAGV